MSLSDIMNSQTTAQTKPYSFRHKIIPFLRNGLVGVYVEGLRRTNNQYRGVGYYQYDDIVEVKAKSLIKELKRKNSVLLEIDLSKKLAEKIRMSIESVAFYTHKQKEMRAAGLTISKRDKTLKAEAETELDKLSDGITDVLETKTFESEAAKKILQEALRYKPIRPGGI